MAKGETSRLIKAAKLYYEDGLSQDEIAKILKVSRPQVSRMITKARQVGYVTICVVDPNDERKSLEKEMIERFGLRDCQIVSEPHGNGRMVETLLAQAAVSYLTSILEPGDSLGVSGGCVLSEMAKLFPEKILRGINVVQLRGGVNEYQGSWSVDIVQVLAGKLSGRAFYLPVPTLVDSKAIRDTLTSDKSVHKALEAGANCTVAIYSVNYPSDHSMLVESGYLSCHRMETMRENGAVGEICSRLYTEKGTIVDPKLDKRTLGIELCQLGHKNYSIAVGHGERLVPGLLGAIRGNFMNVLITDEGTAKKMLEQECPVKSQDFAVLR